ncbi:hypothetical protein Fmac_026339 [Flemingia macrophylla]|uniref:Uncharacterized protein n=1 Tax=Flemingia macrophylla TaxID=520843 RepID=A0ABD1LEK3_9FABA
MTSSSCCFITTAYFYILINTSTVISCAFFFAAIFLNLAKEYSEHKNKKWAKSIAGPMALAIGVLTQVIVVAPDSVASNFVFDMCFGSLVMFIWQKIDKAKVDIFGYVVASGLICGEGLWAIASLMLALSEIKASVWMKNCCQEKK